MDHSEKEDQPVVPPAPKKPYQKPAFRYERVFETQALTCGKVSGTQGSCQHGQVKAS